MNYSSIQDRKTIGDVVTTINTDEVFSIRAEVEKIAGHGLRWIGGADVWGYCEAHKAVVLEYSGRYGKGYAVLTPSFYRGRRSTSYMSLSYLIPDVD